MVIIYLLSTSSTSLIQMGLWCATGDPDVQLEQTHHTRWAPTSYKWGWVVTAQVYRVIAPLIHLFSAIYWGYKPIYNDLGAHIVDTFVICPGSIWRIQMRQERFVLWRQGAERVGWTWFCFIRLEFNSNDLQCIHINIHAQVMMGVILGGVTISLYIWQSVKSPEQKI